MAEITSKFWERAFLVPQYAEDEYMKSVRYHDVLRDGIHEFVSMYNCRNLKDMIVGAREWEIDLGLLKKRKSV